MKIRDITTRGALGVQPDESVQADASRMRQRDQLLGILSLGDSAIVVRAARAGKTLKQVSPPAVSLR